VIPAALIGFALLDGALAGFRAAAGRNGRIDKLRYHLRAMALGVSASAIAIALLAGLTGLVVATAPQPSAVWNELLEMGERLILCLAAFSAVVVLFLGVYAVTQHEVRTFATVAVLGPFTLLRPVVVVAATVWSTRLATTWRTAALGWIATAMILAVGALLHRYHHRRR